MPRILVAGPNLTMQYLHKLPSVQLGGVNRVQSTTLVAAGKGVNVCRALSRLKATTQLLLFSGGLSGQRLERLLSEEKLTFEALPMESDLRVTNTLLGENEITEIIGASPRISNYEEERYLKRLQGLIQTQHWDAIIFTGTSPETGKVPCIYEKIMDVLRDYRTGPVIVDLSRPVVARIKPEKHWFLKINGEEFCNIFDVTEEPSAEELKASILSCAWQGLMVTSGPDESFLKIGDQLIRQAPPRIDEVVNVIGAGDVACASTALSLVFQETPEKLLEKALELASLSCKSQVPGSF